MDSASQSEEKIKSARFRDEAANEIMRLAQGTPIVGYHDKNGVLVIPADLDDEDA